MPAKSLRAAHLMLAAGCLFALTIVGAHAETDPRRTGWYLVQIKCPADNDGVLETLKRSNLKENQVIRIRYRNGAAVRFSISNPGMPNINLIDVDLRSERMSKSDQAFADFFLPDAAKALRHHCLSEPAERQAARAELEANRRKYGF